MESKYGRLFTERDVERIISEALIRQHTQPIVSKIDEVLKHIDPSDLTFHPDEPLFLFRAQDAWAPKVIEQYERMADQAVTIRLEPDRVAFKSDAEYKLWRNAVHTRWMTFHAWQQAHPVA